MSTTKQLLRKYPCCRPVLYRHEDGWDAYRYRDCLILQDGDIVPAFFDDHLVEDAPTKKEALTQLAAQHLWGMCLKAG